MIERQEFIIQLRDQFSKGMLFAQSTSEKATKGITGNLASIAGGVVGGLGAYDLATKAISAMGQAFASVVNTGKDFTKQMSEVKAIVGASEGDFKSLNDQAIKLGASTTFSSTEVASMMTEIGRAGFDTNQILGSTGGFLDLAAASGTDLTRSAEIGMSALNQFGLAATEAGRVADMLAFTANKSATGVLDLGEGLAYVGANAHALGIPLQEILSAQAALGDAGLKGSMATRALGTAMQRLAKPTKAMMATMQAYNIEFFDQDGKYIGLTNMIGMLQEKMKGFTDEQKQNTLVTLFGNEAFGEMNILLSKGASGLREFEKGLNSSSGAAKKASKTMLDNLSGDAEQFSGALESIQLKIFGQGEGIFRTLTQMSTAFINKLSANWEKITAPISKLWKSLSGLVGAFKDLLSTLGLINGETDLLKLFFDYFAWALNNLTLGIRTVADTFTYLISKITAGIDWVKNMWEAMKFLAQNITRLFAPVGELLQGVFTFDATKIKSGLTSFQSTWKQMQGEFWAGMGTGGVLTIQAPTENSPLSPGQTKAGVSTPAVAPSPAISEDTFSGGSGSGRGSISVSIDKLIENLTISTTNIKEAPEQLRKMIAEALTGAVRDVELSY